MARPDLELWSNDERAIRPRQEAVGPDRWLTAIIYYGLGQLALFCAPMIWMIGLSPFYTGLFGLGLIGALVTIPILIGLFRGGYISVGREWPVLTNTNLGTGAGYREYLTRAVYLACTLGLAAYGSAGLALVAGRSVAVNVLGGMAISAVGIALLPYLSATSRRMRAARLGYYVIALMVIGIGAVPTFVAIAPERAVIVAIYVVLAGVDSWPLVNAVR